MPDGQTPASSSWIDVHGKPLRAGTTDVYPARSPYHHTAADNGSAELANYNPALRSADAAFLPERERIGSRIDDIVRNNGWMSGQMQRFVDQAIGADFRLMYQPDWVALGLSAKWARKFARQVEAQFRQWSHDVRGVCDASEHGPLSALLGLSFRQRMVHGETVILPQWLPNRPAIRYATALQVVDPMRLSTPPGRIDDDTIRGGVEINRYGAALGYHFQRTHPGDVFGSRLSNDWTYVPKRTTWGRQRVIHFFEQEQGDQHRGKPIIAPIVERLVMESKLSRIQIQAALLNSIFAAFIESPMDAELIEEGFRADSYQDQRAKFHKDRRITLNGVQIPALFPGEKFGFNTIEHPGDNFEAFENMVLRYFAAATGSSYEQLAQDWSKTNYSSARAALLEAWKFLSARRGHFVNGVATPIFALWFEEAIDKGDVILPDGAPGFWDAFAAWTRCRWIGPGRGWVDPVKEVDAAAKRVDSQFSTHQDEAAEQGRDYEEIVAQRAAEREIRREYGEPDPVGTSPGSQAGAVYPSDEDDAKPNDGRPEQGTATRRSRVPAVRPKR